MNRLTVSQRQKQAERGERRWTQTLKTHGLMTFAICLLGPFSMAHGILYLLLAPDSEYKHIEVDTRRMAYIWIGNSLFWLLLISL